VRVILGDYCACEPGECWKKGLMMAVIMKLTQMRLIVGNSIIVWNSITFIIISIDT
jgi:hypothetical protein